jgi:hypothetical protein
VDYDGVRFRISTPEKKTGLLVSMSIRCWEELVQYGATDVLQREYASYITEPEQGFNFSLAFDLEAIPDGGTPCLSPTLAWFLTGHDIRGARGLDQIRGPSEA